MADALECAGERGVPERGGPTLGGSSPAHVVAPLLAALGGSSSRAGWVPRVVVETSVGRSWGAASRLDAGRATDLQASWALGLSLEFVPRARPPLMEEDLSRGQARLGGRQAAARANAIDRAAVRWRVDALGAWVGEQLARVRGARACPVDGSGRLDLRGRVHQAILAEQDQALWEVWTTLAVPR